MVIGNSNADSKLDLNQVDVEYRINWEVPGCNWPLPSQGSTTGADYYSGGSRGGNRTDHHGLNMGRVPLKDGVCGDPPHYSRYSREERRGSRRRSPYRGRRLHQPNEYSSR